MWISGCQPGQEPFAKKAFIGRHSVACCTEFKGKLAVHHGAKSEYLGIETAVEATPLGNTRVAWGLCS